MKKKGEFRKVWIPRALSILLVVMLYLFVGEVLAENFQWSNLFWALIPGSLYLAVTYIAWKHARSGGMIFIVLGIGLVLFNIFQERNALGAYVLALATFFLGFLFIIFGKVKTRQ